MAIVGNLVANLRLNSATFDRDLTKATRRLTKIGSGLNRLGSDLTHSVTLPLVAISGAVLKVGSDFDAAFAGVRKTVEGTPEQIDAIRTGIREMAKEIGTSTTELSSIAEAAGQLGIETPNVLSFTRTMADLGVTTNLSATQAATSLARLANVMQTDQSKFERLGDVVVDLGNKFATTEAEIVGMALQLSGAGAAIGLTEAEVFGFATALSSVGIEAERGGSAFSRVFTDIMNAVQSGSPDLRKFAELAGQSPQEFARAFKDAPAAAIQSFIEGLFRLRQEGGNLQQVLQSLGLDGIRVADALRRSANAGDLVSRALKTANEQMAKGGALSEEAAKRYKTFERQLKRLVARLKDIGITLFDALRPVLEDTVLPLMEKVIDKIAAMAEGFAKLPRPMQTAIVALFGITAVIGPLLIFISKLIFSVKNIALLFGASGLRGGILKTAAALAARGGFLGALGKTAAFLAGPWGLALAAATTLIVTYKDEIANAIIKTLDWLGIMEDGTRVAGEKMRESVTSLTHQISKQLGILPDIGLKSLTGLQKGSKAWSEALQHNHDNLRALQKAMIAHRDEVLKLKAQYDSGKLSIGEYNEKLKEALDWSPVKDAAKGITDVGDAAAAAGPPLIDMSVFTDDATDSLEALRTEATEILTPLTALNAKVKEFAAAGVSTGQIALLLADDFKSASDRQAEMAEIAEYLGIKLKEVPLSEQAKKAKELAGRVLEVKNAKELAAEAIEKLKKQMREGTALIEADIKTTLRAGVATRTWSDETLAAVQSLGKMRKETVATVRTIREMIAAGYSVEKILLATGISADSLRSRMKTLGIEMDEVTGAFLRHIEAGERNREMAKALQATWVESMGQIKSRFIEGLGAMIFEGEKFSFDVRDIFTKLGRAVVEILLQELFNPVLDLIAKLGSALIRGLGNLFTGGSFSSAFTGLFDGGSQGGGILSTILGGGATAGTAALAGGGALATTSLSALPFTGLTVPLTTSLAAGGTAAAGATAAATTTTAASSGGILSSLSGFFTNPWTIGIGGAIAAFFALRGVFSRGIGDVAKDIQRDFKIAFSTDQLKSFTNQLGISKDTFQKFTKSISLSPAFVKFAQSVGVSDQAIISAFSSVEVFGREIDLSAEAAAAAAGDFSLLNTAFKELFGSSDQLIDALGGSLDKLLAFGNEASATADSISDSALTTIEALKAVAGGSGSLTQEERERLHRALGMDAGRAAASATSFIPSDPRAQAQFLTSLPKRLRQMGVFRPGFLDEFRGFLKGAQADTPHLQTGGRITRAGLAFLHDEELVLTDTQANAIRGTFDRLDALVGSLGDRLDGLAADFGEIGGAAGRLAGLGDEGGGPSRHSSFFYRGPSIDVSGRNLSDEEIVDLIFREIRTDNQGLRSELTRMLRNANEGGTVFKST